MWLNRYISFLVFATFLLIIAGGLVTSTGSGLAVPDWPLSYGKLMPPMVGGVFYEHGHRMVATTVGLLTVVMVFWLWRSEPRRWVRMLGLVALGGIILQGLLGGLTVLLLLPTSVSALHATIAQTFFCTVICLALFTSEEWSQPHEKSPAAASGHHPWRLCLATTAVIYTQLILGSVVRHSSSALAIPDFPLAFGSLIPHFTNAHIAIQFAHRAWGAVTFAFVSATLLVTFRRYFEESRLLYPALLLWVLTAGQLMLGGWVIWTRTAVPISTAHVALGALILAISVVLTVRAYWLYEFAGEIHDPATTTQQQGELMPAGR